MDPAGIIDDTFGAAEGTGQRLGNKIRKKGFKLITLIISGVVICGGLWFVFGRGLLKGLKNGK